MRPLLIGLILKRRVGTVSAEADSKSFVGVTDRAELIRRAAQAVKNTAKSVGEATSVREAKSYLTSDLLKMKSKVISQSSGVFRD
ncbi:hypothetical protein F2Q69_00038938 [Brassica cretica]|uniref:Uncharacterized protein n=1 Tax=Brassica cretica TaxID=69181 RepID=A0A8S9SBQ7_BRACR|nr:hypothetical protein F2Q69_00038938 [Brassica cretica]